MLSLGLHLQTLCVEDGRYGRRPISSLKKRKPVSLLVTLVVVVVIAAVEQLLLVLMVVFCIQGVVVALVVVVAFIIIVNFILILVLAFVFAVVVDLIVVCLTTRLLLCHGSRPKYSDLERPLPHITPQWALRTRKHLFLAFAFSSVTVCLFSSKFSSNEPRLTLSYVSDLSHFQL